jgi:phosphoserine aminotransferase
MAGIAIDFNLADVWYASVQKCFGLPAGLAVLILSPRAVERSAALGENAHYNSLNFVIDNARKEQTHYTPNVLNIYLLYRTQQYSSAIKKVDEKIRGRYDKWKDFLESVSSLDWLIEKEALRSKTVLTLSCKEPGKVKTRALDSDIILGNGYGPWKDHTIRIANFPAIKGKEIEYLTKFIKRNLG